MGNIIFLDSTQRQLKAIEKHEELRKDVYDRNTMGILKVITLVHVSAVVLKTKFSLE